MSATATPVPQAWIGFFDKSGSPALTLKISGPIGEGQEFNAILDTGFTGFISMPLLMALPLGLILYGTTSVELADGSQSMKLTARGMAEIAGESEVGVVILEPSSSDILLGMAFLRLFKKALFLTSDTVLLVAENSTPTPSESETDVGIDEPSDTPASPISN